MNLRQMIACDKMIFFFQFDSCYSQFLSALSDSVIWSSISKLFCFVFSIEFQQWNLRLNEYCAINTIQNWILCNVKTKWIASNIVYKSALHCYRIRFQICFAGIKTKLIRLLSRWALNTMMTMVTLHKKFDYIISSLFFAQLSSFNEGFRFFFVFFFYLNILWFSEFDTSRDLWQTIDAKIALKMKFKNFVYLFSLCQFLKSFFFCHKENKTKWKKNKPCGGSHDWSWKVKKKKIFANGYSISLG